MFDKYVFAFCTMTEMVPRSGGGENTSTVIKLDTVRKIAEQVTVGAQITTFKICFHVLTLILLLDVFSLLRTSTLCWTSLPLQWRG